MTQPPRVLLLEDDRTIRRTLGATLEDAGYEVTAVEGIADARRALAQASFDAALFDVRLRDGSGLSLLEEVRRDERALPVLIVTAYGDSDSAIRAMKAGAFEYVTKPFDVPTLLARLARAVQARPVARANAADAQATLVGASPAILDVWKSIGRAAASRAPVLVTGESGVGKELVARALHEHGVDPKSPFVAVNIAALSPSLVESELFGHEKGAFTGAAARREGRFERAQGGTLFLDEIGDLDVGLQTKLLRVLEDGGYERVGGATRLTSTARIVAATSQPVMPGTPGARLREDLFYRLAVVRIEVPPLRERAQDIPLLVEAFLRRAPGPRRAVSEAAMARLVGHDWPGNVRQLRHVLESACVMSATEILDVDDLDLPQATLASVDEGSLDLRAHLERLERTLIERALANSHGNRAQAARLLGIRRALLYARMKHFGMRGDDEPRG